MPVAITQKNAFRERIRVDAESSTPQIERTISITIARTARAENAQMAVIKNDLKILFSFDL